MYNRRLSRSAIWTGVSVSVPLIVPLVVPVTTRSKTTGPRTPVTGPLCTCAIVAGDFNPSNVPVMVSLLSARTAVAHPEPVMFAIIAMSTGTGARRALYVLVDFPRARTHAAGPNGLAHNFP